MQLFAVNSKPSVELDPFLSLETLNMQVSLFKLIKLVWPVPLA
jgi:hypothetical protein